MPRLSFILLHSFKGFTVSKHCPQYAALCNCIITKSTDLVSLCSTETLGARHTDGPSLSFASL